MLFSVSIVSAYILNGKAIPSDVQIGSEAKIKIDISAPFAGAKEDIKFSKEGITIQSFSVEGNNLILNILVSETTEPGDVTIQIDNTPWGKSCCTLSNVFTLIAKAENQVYTEKEKEIVKDDKDVKETVEEDKEPNEPKTDTGTETKIATKGDTGKTYSMKILGIDLGKFNFGFLDVVNWGLNLFRSKDDNGDNPRDTPPPTIYGEEPDGNVCGPDVTDKVFDVLQRTQERYDSWSPEERKQKCGLLTNPLPSLTSEFPFITFDAVGAWDIGPLSPAAAKTGGFKNFARDCGKPDWPCGLTVEFIDECIHFQVLNYIQWGAMSSLCSGDFPQHQRAAFNVHALYGGLKWTTGLSSANLQGQFIMSLLGRYFMASLNTWNTYPEFYGYDKDRWREKTKENLKKKLDELLQDPEFSLLQNPEFSEWLNRPELKCSLTCKLREGEKNFWKDWNWDYRWGDHDGI